jgi:hypothetical protein
MPTFKTGGSGEGHRIAPHWPRRIEFGGGAVAGLPLERLMGARGHTVELYFSRSTCAGSNWSALRSGVKAATAATKMTVNSALGNEVISSSVMS